MSYLPKLQAISTFIFDIDGVLTDGSVIVTESGEQQRIMNIKDGYALQLAIKKGYRIAIISGGSSEGVRDRFTKLGVTDVFMSSHNKLKVFNDYCEKHSLEHKEILYMGDDIPDIKVLQLVGIPTCPLDAVAEVKAVSIYISHQNGGKGAVRDVIEQVLKVQDNWMQKDAFNW